MDAEKQIKAMRTFERLFGHNKARGDGWWEDPHQQKPETLYKNWYRAIPTEENYKRLKFVFCSEQLDELSFEKWARITIPQKLPCKAGCHDWACCTPCTDPNCDFCKGFDRS